MSRQIIPETLVKFGEESEKRDYAARVRYELAEYIAHLPLNPTRAREHFATANRYMLELAESP